MVVLLVVLTLAGFLCFDWYRYHRRTRVVRTEARPTLESDTPGRLPGELFLHPGHGWVRVDSGECVVAGSTTFATGFIGRISGIDLPRRGERLRQGMRAWTLISSVGRRLSQVMPVGGEVVEVNPRLAEDPGLMHRRPYAEGWILRIKPDRLAECLSNLLHGTTARGFLESCKSQVTTRFAPDLGPLATDGGELCDAFGDRIDEHSWVGLKRELFPVTAAQVGPPDHSSVDGDGQIR